MSLGRQPGALHDARPVLASTTGPPNRETVEHYVIRKVPIARPSETVAAFRERLFDRRYDDAGHVFLVTDAGGLAGVINIRDIIGEPPTATLADLAKNTECQTATFATDREEAASKAIHAGVSVVAVCEADGRFVGALPASALVSILRDEHLEDLHHMVGILGKSEAAKAALTAPPFRRALYRLPWLLVGMAGSAIATATMVRFEAQIAANIAVAFFIPAIVYLADAVGTQTEAVAVRGLSLGSADLPPLLAGEISTGGHHRRGAGLDRLSHCVAYVRQRGTRRDCCCGAHRGRKRCCDDRFPASLVVRIARLRSSSRVRTGGHSRAGRTVASDLLSRRFDPGFLRRSR